MINLRFFDLIVSISFLIIASLPAASLFEFHCFTFLTIYGQIHQFIQMNAYRIKATDRTVITV